MSDADVKHARQNWKYQTVESATVDGISLNQSGKMGWELVTIISKPGDPNRLIAIFKKLADD